MSRSAGVSPAVERASRPRAHYFEETADTSPCRRPQELWVLSSRYHPL